MRSLFKPISQHNELLGDAEEIKTTRFRGKSQKYDRISETDVAKIKILITINIINRSRDKKNLHL